VRAMPRYEFSEGTSNKFWEIQLAGKSFTTTYGRIGSDGQTTIKKFKSDAEAKKEHDKLVAEKTKKGYQLVGGANGAADADEAPAAVHARDAKLEAAIYKDPDDPDLYLVYGDWLQAQGDPRGELIALQHAAKSAPAKKLLDAHAAHFWGKLADCRDLLEPQEDWRKKQIEGSPTKWGTGFLQSIWIANNFDRSTMHDGKLSEIDVAEALGWLLDHPSARFVRELTVGIIDYEENSYAGIAKVIGKRELPTLRALYLGDFSSEDTELNWSRAGDLSPIYKACPNLEVLTIRSGSMKLGKIALPKLTTLRVITGGLDKASLKSVCEAKWPALEHLSLQLGQDGGIKVKDLQPIFDGKAFPKLTHLGLGNAEITDAICEALATSRIAAQLESLDLSQGTMGDAGATALAAGKFGKLASLDVSDNWLSKKGIAALKGVAKKIESKEQQDDEGDPESRYIAAYE
jgi:uncharacterized protein (TIGR02996 family)